jgi:hypothetical protein
MDKKIPPPPISLSELEVGDSFSYEFDHARFHHKVVGFDEERRLPVVEITASQTESPGYPIVDRLNTSPIRGILLGSCGLLTGEPQTEGIIYLGRAETGLAIEMCIDGEVSTGLFPAPEPSVTSLDIVKT